MRNISSSLLLLPLLAIILGLMTACRSTNTGVTDPAICAIFPPISYSARDEPQTRLEIRRHNAAFDSFCARQWSVARR